MNPGQYLAAWACGCCLVWWAIDSMLARISADQKFGRTWEEWRAICDLQAEAEQQNRLRNEAEIR